MNTKRIVLPLALFGLLATLAIDSASGQTTAFTYQGRLTYQGNAASGNWDLTFGLFDAVSGGSQIGSTLTNLNVAASNGLFTVTLDFGAGAFPGADRWLELGVQTNGGGGFTTLIPRQSLTPAPYAVTAATAGGGWPTTWTGSAITSAVAEAAHATNADNAVTAGGGWPTTWAGSAITSAVAEAAHATNADNAVTASGGWPTTWAGSAITSAVAQAAHATNADNAVTAGGGWPTTWAGSAITSAVAEAAHATNADNAMAAGGGWPTTWAGSAITSAVAEAAHATNADNVTGSITDSQLSANVPLLNGTNTFSGTNVFSGVLKNVVGGVEFYMVPRGGIIIWSGSAASIPGGWALCDGTQGTPNLTDKFVVGAGNTYAVAATGGATSHTHNVAMGGNATDSAGAHTHTLSGSTDAESGHTHSTPNHTHTVPSHTHTGGDLAFSRQYGSSAAYTGGGQGGFSISVIGTTSSVCLPNSAQWFGNTGGTALTTASGGGGTTGAGSAHSHTLTAASAASAGAHTHTISFSVASGSASSLPPYYALCYIMKL